MAIIGTNIRPRWTYSTNTAGALVLPPEQGIVTYKIEVEVDAADEGASGKIAISNLSTGVTVLDNPPLTANGKKPYTYLRLQAAPSTATQIEFTATPTVDKSNTTGTATPLTPAPTIAWAGAGTLIPTVVTALAAPDDIPALDTSDPTATALVTVTLRDSANQPMEGVNLLIGPTLGTEDISGYTVAGVYGPATYQLNGIDQTGGEAYAVQTDTNGRAGIQISCPAGTLSAQAQILSWGAQLLGHGDAHFFQSQDEMFIGPLNTSQSPDVPAPVLYDADGTEYDPPSDATSCLLDLKASWDNPQKSDRVLLIVGDLQSGGRPRAKFSVEQTDYGATLSQGTMLKYNLDPDRLVSGNRVALRFIAFHGNRLSTVSFSYPNTYNIGPLPPPAPSTNKVRVLPAPRLFVKSVNDASESIIDRELPNTGEITVNWPDIQYGGLYVFIPYAATNGAAGMSGDATIKIYRNGVYRNKLPEVGIPLTYPPVQVTDTPITVPHPANITLGNGILMLIPTSDLANWNSPSDGIARAFQVEYWDANSDYSKVWNGSIDTVSIRG